MKGFSEPISNHGSWEYELDTELVRWSPALYRIHGVNPSDFKPTRASITAAIHPDDRDHFGRIVAAAIEAKAPFAYQHRIVLPGDAERVVLVRGAYLDGPEGAPRLVGTTQDVTGRAGDQVRL